MVVAFLYYALAIDCHLSTATLGLIPTKTCMTRRCQDGYLARIAPVC